MEITRHARTRMQQRGILSDDIHCLVRYGRTEYDHHGSRILYLDKAGRERISVRLGSRLAERLCRLYAVLGHDGALVTVGHRHHRIRRH
jgi:hypothetical protein